MPDDTIDYKQWGATLMTLLDLIAVAESLEEVKALTVQRFEIAREYGMEIVFTGIEVTGKPQ